MRPRRTLIPILLAAAALLAACGGSNSSNSSATTRAAASARASASTSATSSTATSTTPKTSAAASGPIGPEGIPLEQGPALAPASSTTPGATVDGIKCAPIEQLVYHIHARLQVYVDGQSRALPAAIGLLGPVSQKTAYGPFYGAQQCYYWLHTHTSDGVIHVESPSKRVYTLGNFFDEWRQPLSGTQVAGDKGKVTAFLNGKPWKRDPRAIPLVPHASIQLDVGSPAVAAHVVSWAGTSL